MAKLVFIKDKIGDTLEIDKEVAESFNSTAMAPALVNGIATFVIGVVNCYPDKVETAVEKLVEQMYEQSHVEVGIDASTVLVAGTKGKTITVSVYSIKPEIR